MNINLKEAILSTDKNKVIDMIINDYYISSSNLGWTYHYSIVNKLFPFYYKWKEKIIRNKKIKNAYKNYNNFFESIREVSPSYKEDDDKWVIIPYMVYDKNDGIEDKYLSISSYKLNDLKEFQHNPELENIEDINTFTDVSKAIEICDNTKLPQRYSYMLDRWENTLASLVDIEGFKKFGFNKTIGCCIYEMTFIGFTKKDVDKKLEKMKKEYEEDNKVIKKKEVSSINEMFEDINDTKEYETTEYTIKEKDHSYNCDLRRKYALVGLKCLKSEYESIKNYCERMMII